ncbi:FCPF [Symbiodinium necroappetens]|uniref:FCPF protein n=1 Tax=Symbiodinium necroappetens TaxID=1628268 RepID=A0A813B7Q5_9DINO|nr:FCPF [Symbiodinium sp. KB8]CAE7523866.1 FCPF [Symbiodinium microadriaticum]CAE7891926.1 FCPF [Symbiodinium necroappetens]
MAPRKALALALPAAALAAAPLFVTPGSVPRASQPSRGQPVQDTARSSSISAFTAAGSAAAVAVVAASARSKNTKVVRQFFGGESTSAASFDPAKELGVQDPVGFWDPLGLSADKDEATFKRRRAVEIKHGRIAMYATMGYIVPEYFKFPGYLSPSLGLKFSDVPNGLAALSKLPVLGGAQIIAFCGLIETTGFFQADSTTGGRGPREGKFSMKDSTESGEPGNYGVGFPTFIGKVEDPEARKSKLAAELANGRLAMMAIIGMFFQDGLTGSAWGDWSLYTASPLRAAEEEAAPPPPPPFDPRLEVGVLPPLDYFDPAGFCPTGDEENFRKLRAAELKHGRVAMMAALGAAVQHYVQFPGFDEVPTGLGAVTTAPGTYGFAALFLLSGALELGLWTEDPSKEPGNFGDPLNLGQYDIDMRNKELNNGRFAMFSAIGILVAELYTGKDGIDQIGLDTPTI